MVTLEQGWAVYQVKKFARALGPAQKRQVCESMDALRSDARVKDLEVCEWHLVMPWDETQEERLWLDDQAKQRQLPQPLWHGRTWCDARASMYPTVVDYYFHGNRETVKAQAQDLLALFQVGAGKMEPDAGEILARMEQQSSALNRLSPHYEYGFSTLPIPAGADVEEFLTHVARQPVVHPGHVLTRLRAQAGMVAVLHVLAKTAMSTELEPITVQSTVRVGPEQRGQLFDMLTFGTGLTLPLGSVSGEVNAPAGAGGHFANAALLMTPYQPVEPHWVRIVVVDPQGQEMASLPMRRTSFTQGPELSPEERRRAETALQQPLPVGVQVVLQDDHELLTLTSRWTDQGEVTISLKTHFDATVSAVDALPVASLLAQFRPPYRILFAERRGPYDASSAQPLGDVDSQAIAWRSDLHRVVQALSILQDHTNTELHVPTDLSETEVDWNHVVQSAALAAGHMLTINTDASVIGAAVGSFAQMADHVEIHAPGITQTPEATIRFGQEVYVFRGHFREIWDDPEVGQVEVWTLDDPTVTVKLESQQ